MKKISKKVLAIFMIAVFLSTYSTSGVGASTIVSWDTQSDFLNGSVDSNLELYQSPGDIKLKQNLNNLTQTTASEFDNGNSNNGIDIKDENGGELSLSGIFAYKRDDENVRCDFGFMMTPIYDEDSGLFYCGSYDGLYVIDTKKTENFLDDEELFVYSPTSSPAIASGDIKQIYLNNDLNLIYIATAAGLSVIDTKGTKNPSDDELVNTYSTTSTPAIASNDIWYVDFDASSGLLYASAYNGGLSVINTQNTVDPTDDTLVFTYSATSTPAIAGNRVSFSTLDAETDLLYVGTWNSGVTVIDTNGTISAADDTVSTSYSTAAAPHLNHDWIERIYLDKDENLLYIPAQSGAPGALNVVDLDSNTSFAYKADGVYDTTASAAGVLISPNSAIGSNSIKDVFVDKNTGYMYVAHYNTVDSMTVIDTKETYDDPSDDTVHKTYGNTSDPRIPDYAVGFTGYRIGHNSQQDMLYLKSGEGVFFMPLEEKDSYQGRYESDYFKYADIPSSSLSWQGDLEGSDVSAQFRSTEDSDIKEVISDFDDGNTSEYLGDFYGWGGYFQDSVESGGTMKLSNPTPNSWAGDEWVDFWFDTGKPDNYYPIGTVVRARIRVNTDRQMGSYTDYMIGDEWVTNSTTYFENDNWRVVEFEAASTFSKVGFDVNWDAGTWDNLNDSFEIDWIRFYDGSITWSDWSEECSNRFGCEIPGTVADEYFQYRLNIAGDLDNEISEVTLSSGYQPSGTYTSANFELSQFNQDLLSIDIDKSTPSGTAVNMKYSINRGDSWIDIGNVDTYDFPKNTKTKDFMWRATLTTNDLNETPVLHGVTLAHSESPLTIDLKDIDDVTTNSLELEVKVKNYESRTLDFKVRVRNVETNTTEEIKFTEKVDKNGKVKLPIEDLLPGTEYTFKVKVSEEDKGDYSNYSNTMRVTTDEEGVPILASFFNNDSTVDVTTESNVPADYVATPVADEESKAPSPASPSPAPQEALLTTDPEKTPIIPKDFIKTTIEENPVITSTTVATGLVAGAAAAGAAATSSIPFFPLVPGLLRRRITEALGLAHMIASSKKRFGFPTKRKGEKHWGVVFDSYTKHPISEVLIQLVDTNKRRVVDQTVSDESGRFGFLVDKGSNYEININKGSYKLDKERVKDDLYGKLYNTPIDIKEGEVLQLNIALIAKGFNWERFASKIIGQYRSLSAKFVKYILDIIYISGFGISIYAAIIYPSIINYVILAFYGIFLVLRVIAKNKNKFGTIISRQSKKPLPFTVIELFDKNTDQRVNFTVSDILGRYYLLAADGSYRLKIKSMSSLDGSSFEGEDEIKIKDGILREDLMV